MKLGWLPRAAIVLIAPMLSMVAAAQSGGGNTGRLDIPTTVQFVGKQDPGIRKATAIVNGEIITGSDIDHRMALIIASNQIQLPPEEVERFRAQVLRNLIDETLQIQAATQQEITVEQRDVDSYYQRFAQSFRHTPETFSTYLRAIGSSERSMKRQIRGELAWQRLQRRQIEPFVTVGDEEVQAVIARLNASRGTSEYRVAEIFISSTPETAAEVRANAARIVQQLRAGASFAAYARQFSEASTAALGGELGWVRAEQLPEELAALVRQMPVGAFSDPIPVPGGFSIVAVADTRQILVADPRDAVLSLMQMTDHAARRHHRGPGGRARRAARPGHPGDGRLRPGPGDGRQRSAPSSSPTIRCGCATCRRRCSSCCSTSASARRRRPSARPTGSACWCCAAATIPRSPPARPSTRSITQLNEERVNRRAQRYLRDLRRDAVVDYR